MFQKILLIGLAGALGTLARYGLAGGLNRLNGDSIPWGTFTVNILGCLLVGMLWVMFERRMPVDSETRVLVLVGFFGAFTTFSAFILETSVLASCDKWVCVGINIMIHNMVGFAALIAGMSLGKLFWRAGSGVN